VWAVAIVIAGTYFVATKTGDDLVIAAAEVAVLTLFVGMAALIAAVLAAKYAYDQLVIVRDDQKRVLDQLSRRPQLLIGFDEPYVIGPGGIRGNGAAIQASAKVATGAHELGFTLKNTGELTARDIVINLQFPRVVGKPQWGGVDRDVGTGLREDLNGAYRFILHVPPINPDAFRVLPLIFRPSSVPQDVGIVVSMSFADVPSRMRC